MRARLIHVTTKRSGALARREEIVEADQIAIGRGTDNPIHVGGLTVSLHHAAFVATPDGVFVERRDAPDLMVNGSPVSSRRVRQGDVVRVGQHELRIVAPGPGEQLAVEIVEAALAGGERDDLARRTRIGIERGWLTRRKLSWAALAAVLGVFLAAPLWLRRGAGDAAAPIASGGGVAAAVALPPLDPALRLLNASWNVGTISRPHGPIADRCETCHAVPFAAIPDGQCAAVGCHADVGAHAADQASVARLADARCTSCHQEHLGDAALILTEDRLCTGCHATLQDLVPDTSLEDVLDFAAAHPELRPSVLVELASTERRRVTLGTPEAREQSGLRFPHDVHLRPDLRGPKGPTQLECASCHRLEPDGAMQTKVRFDRDCQPCHRLAFVEAEPGREAPHATPDVVREAVFEAFAARALRDLPEDPPSARGGPALRRPGGAIERQREAALAAARRQSDLATAILLGEEGPCADCHFLASEGETLEVLPVHVVPLEPGQRWMPLSRFSHAPHMRVPCTDCHAAESASSAEIVLMPGIESCRPCHAGEDGAPGKVASSCLMCHAFHHPGLGRMRPADAGAEGRTAQLAPLRAGSAAR